MTHQTVSLGKYWKLFPTTLKEWLLMTALHYKVTEFKQGVTNMVIGTV